MQQVTAFKCERSGRIFEYEKFARRSEFNWLIRDVSRHIPNPERGLISGEEIMEWLADKLEGGIYPSALPALLKAVEYLVEHRAVIEGKDVVTVQPSAG